MVFALKSGIAYSTICLFSNCQNAFPSFRQVVIWAKIKAQKVQEESERQLARAQGTQTIDVAALAAGSLSPQSLAFMPAGRIVEAEIVDGETASQRASTPRPVSNASEPVAARREVQAPAIEIPFESSQPAIDEKSFTAPIQAANGQGQGGPFIATSASSTPVASTLINGEPVVVLRIGPIFATNAPASAEANNVVTEEANDFAASVFPARPAAPSPLAVLSLNKPALDAAGVRVASAEPQLMAARPRTKPVAVVEIVQATKPKPVRAAPVLTAAAAPQPGDVFQPSSRSDLAFDELPSASAPLQVPGDIPSEHFAIPVTEPAPSHDSEPPPPATSGPAALVPMPQE